MSASTTLDFKNLVLARIQAMPQGTAISIGGGENLSKAEILRHVELDDEIGKQMIEIEKSFLQALKNGSLFADE